MIRRGLHYTNSGRLQGKEKRVQQGKLLKVLGGIGGIGMVNNNFNILDEGNLKNLPKVDYMSKPQYVFDFEYQLCLYKSKLLQAEHHKKSMVVTIPGRGQGFQYPFTQSTYDEACTNYNTLYNDVFMQRWLMEYEMNGNKLPKMFWKSKEICNFLGVTPFTPYYMINISPNWDEFILTGEMQKQFKNCSEAKITILKDIFNSWMQEEWFDNWEYVIENGSDGKHIHLHAVCHINPKRYKSTLTHISKCRHVRQLEKYAKKWGVSGGIINGKGIQTNIIRNEEMYKDKLLYLHEDTKPEGHKNKSIIENGYVTGCL